MNRDNILQRYLPGIRWIREYRRGYLKGDFLAGLTVAVMLVPQAMGYALLAGLPPVTGLYASTIPLILYALFGSSRHLAVGPVAMVSLLVFSTASAVAVPGSDRYHSVVVYLALMSGILQVVLGILRAGFIVNFISDAVIVGFTSAAALIIVFSQLGSLLGIPLKGNGFIALIHSLINNISAAHPVTCIFSAGSIALLLVLRKKTPKFPAAVLVALLAMLAVYLLKLDESGIAILGTIPKGIPLVRLPAFDRALGPHILAGGAGIVFVGYIESIAIARSLAAKRNYHVEPDSELIGLGMSNLGAGLFSGFPVTGGLARTAVNADAGAQSPLASLVTAGIIVLTLMFLTPLFYFLPKAVLASIVIVAVTGLVEPRAWVQLFSIRFTDGSIALVTFLVTLLKGIEYGILTGIVYSLLIFLWNASRPGIIELGYVKRKHSYLNIKRYPEAKTFPGVLIIRIDGPLFFANTGFIENYLRNVIEKKNKIKAVVINMSGINDADAVSINRLGNIVHEYADRGIRFHFAEMKGVVRDLFSKAKWQKCCGQQIEYASLEMIMEGLAVYGE